MLRALGTTRRQVFGLMLGEAVLIGLAGTIIGELIGVAARSEPSIGRVTQTINDLYFVVNVRDVSVAPLTLVKGGSTRARGDRCRGDRSVDRGHWNTEPREALVRSELEARAQRAVPVLAALGSSCWSREWRFCSCRARACGSASSGLFCRARWLRSADAAAHQGVDGGADAAGGRASPDSSARWPPAEW